MLKQLHKTLTLKWVILPSLAIICFIITEILSRNPESVEQYYSQGIYPHIAIILSAISSIFPFSIDDIFYLALLLIPVMLIVLLLFKRTTFKFSGKLILNLLSSIYILFYILWGFNYFRPNVNQRLGIHEEEKNKEEFIQVFNHLIHKTNSLHCNTGILKKDEVERLVEESYQNLAQVLNIQYPMGKRPDKQITFSGFYAKTGISGYFGPFFNEVHVNKKVLPVEYPFILAHEKAHQLGITSEAEANFYAWMACNYSKSKQLQYSGNLILLHHFIIQAYSMEEYPELIKQIDQKVKADFNARIEHWRLLRNDKMDKAASKVNNAYLKTNKVKEGIKDYQGVVKHVMNFSLDSTFLEKYNLVVN